MSGEMTTRRAVTEALHEVMKDNESVVFVSSDSVGVVKAQDLVEQYPERIVEAGIAEQLAMDAAAGLASSGLIPVYVTYAVFATMRACEQLRTTVAYSRLNVKVVGANGGMGAGEREGVSHQCFEDIGILRTIPGITILSPSDASQVKSAIKAAIAIEGPVYIRTGSGRELDFHDKDTPFTYGGVNCIHETGEDILILTHGFIIHEVKKACGLLDKEGITCTALEVPTIKPLPREDIVLAAKKADRVVVVEDHSSIGGLGSAVAELLSEVSPMRVTRIGVQDCFPESGTAEELYEKYGLNASAIAKRVKDAVILES